MRDRGEGGAGPHTSEISADEISADEARRIAIWAQGLSGARPASVGAMLDHLGAVQLDTISVLARSHELVAHARMGAVSRDVIEDAYWNGDTAFEYWSHAACLLPMRMWPWFAFRRRAYRRRGWRWHNVPQRSVDAVRRRLRSDGPLTTRELGGAKRSAEWWDWSDAKVAIEWLLDVGEVVCARRVGWRRVYDLTERVVPDGLLAQPDWVDVDGVPGPSDEECMRHLVAASVRALGVATVSDIADVHRLTRAQAMAGLEALDESAVHRVRVRGWTDPAWADPAALAWLGEGRSVRHRSVLLSPFDSLIWERQRMERIFGMRHRIEAYVPAGKRVHGYFAMPVLHSGRLVARVDPAREGRTLIARRITVHEGVAVDPAIDGVARALAEAATWVGASAVRLDDVRPPGQARRLRSRLTERGVTATLGS